MAYVRLLERRPDRRLPPRTDPTVPAASSAAISVIRSPRHGPEQEADTSTRSDVLIVRSLNRGSGFSKRIVSKPEPVDKTYFWDTSDCTFGQFGSTPGGEDGGYARDHPPSR
jgi:hypothetical protein